MRSNKPKTIEISLVKLTSVDLPPFIGVIHRHFQKAQPQVADAKDATLVAPIDLLDMIAPTDLLDRIESIEIRYKR